MNFDAIYMVKEHGSQSYFYGESAGDYQTAFDALQCLQNMISTCPVPVDMLITKLIYSPDFPDDIVYDDPDEEPGPFVFQSISKEQAESTRAPGGEPASCVVELDFDQGYVRYSPNTSVPIESSIIQKELTVRMEAGLRCCQKSLLDAMRCKCPSRYLDALNQLLADRFPALAAEWEQMRGRTALYTVRELEEELFFRANYGGGLVNPIAVLQTMQEAIPALVELSINPEASYLIRGILPSGRMVGIPTSRYGMALFEELEPDTFQELLATMDRQEDIAEHVTLDFDEGELTIRCGEWLSPGGGATLRLPFGKAVEALEQAKRDACHHPGDYDGNVEQFLTEKLPQAVSDCTQAQADGPELTL